MKTLTFIGLVALGVISFGCYDPFYQIPNSCREDRLISFMKQYHNGINRDFEGRAPLRDFDKDGKNDFYVVGKDKIIVAQLTSKQDKVWYALGTNGVWKR